jgi:surface polysaccharide O-acyltransferase-like enzyme
LAFYSFNLQANLPAIQRPKYYTSHMILGSAWCSSGNIFSETQQFVLVLRLFGIKEIFCTTFKAESIKI